MATATVDRAVRDYLVALKDLAALRDEEHLGELRNLLEASTDPIERLQLRQQLLQLESPSLQQYEQAFIDHARTWAEEQHVGAEAFAAEGVPAAVLRRAGFGVSRRGRGRAPGRPGAAGRGPRRRTSAQEVRNAIPTRGTFTVQQLQERSGASAAVVRRIVHEEVAAGRVTDLGPDPDHHGPGRAPTLYEAA